MPPKQPKTASAKTIKKTNDLSDMDTAAPAADKPTSTLEERVYELETQVADLRLMVDVLNKYLSDGKAANTTKEVTRKEKSQTVFDWFKRRLGDDDVLFSAIMKGTDPSIWPHGEYKTKYLDKLNKFPVGNDQEEVRKKAAHSLWTKCFDDDARKSIKDYREKVDPPPPTTKRGSKKVKLMSDTEADDEKPPTTSATKPSAKAAKPAAKVSKPKPKGKGKGKVQPEAEADSLRVNVDNNDDETADDSDSKSD